MPPGRTPREILVVDGHSTDRTREIAAAKGARVVLDAGRGKGEALRRSFVEARHDILVFIDADGSHDPKDIPRLVAPIREGTRSWSSRRARAAAATSCTAPPSSCCATSARS